MYKLGPQMWKSVKRIYLNKLHAVVTPSVCASAGELRDLLSHKLFLDPSLGLSII